MEEREMLLWLSAGQGLFRREVRRLKKSVPQLCDLFSCSEADLAKAGAPETLVQGLRDRNRACRETEHLTRFLADSGIRFVVPEDPDWPERFRVLSDPPLWLYVRGSLPDESEPTVSVIGSRNATNYGLRMAEFLSRELARKGVGIVSGLAAGIDGASQMAAMQAGGRSYGVLGCGVNICYPKENYELFHEILSSGRGGILSEFAPGVCSARWHFPDRNRLIAALGDCLAVVEARGPKSGSMITVGCALDLGREVFAVPGRITDPLSRGCNELIQSGATILTGPDDILDLLGVKRCGRMPPRKRDGGDLSGGERKVYEFLSEDPCFIDEIARKTGVSGGELMSILLKLELEGYVLQTSGNYYAAVMH